MKKDKNFQKLAIFKKGFKKNEVIIYSIALMLVTAGYFNYSSNLDNSTIETDSRDISSINCISDGVENKDDLIAKNYEKTENEDDNIGDAQLVDSKSVVDEQTDYFTSSKLERDTNYADALSTYTKIIEDNSISETQKTIAMKEITKINEIKNAINISENLMLSKGFENYVVLVNNDSINVVVRVTGGLDKQKVAQINNIISREFNCRIENIHISENIEKK